MSHLVLTSVSDTLHHPLTEVWSVVSAFGDLKSWHPQVTACTTVGDGVGCTRIVRLGRRIAIERLEILESTDRAATMEYEIVGHSDTSIIGQRGRVELTAISANGTEITWSAMRPTNSMSRNDTHKLSSYYSGRIGDLRRRLDMSSQS